MALLLREEQVRRLASPTELIKAIDLAMGELGSGVAQNQPRRRVFPPAGVLNVMFASWPGGGVSGLKSYSVSSGQARFVVLLYDLQGELIALVEADHLGAMRTGAASGVAARRLLAPGPKIVGIIGTGKQAETQVIGLRAAIDVSELRVYGRDPARRADFARRVGAVACDSPEDCVRGSAVVVTMTPSREPVLESEWVGQASLVIGAGSNYPNRRELPGRLVQRARAVVVDQIETALLESGDLLLNDYDPRNATELGAVISGDAQIPLGEEPLLFESHGLALWDVAAAKVVVEAARAAGIGQEVKIG